ncbi:MAG: RlmE family RNA methyltransferase [Polyangiaceae bacterium]
MSGYKRADSYTKAAKAKGFPARSVFKLEEIDRKTHILKPGFRVLDLGAAPGSWSLYASQKIGPKGVLLAVDLQPLAQVLPPNCTFVQANIYELDRTVIAEKSPYDVIISDMAPNTTGDRFTDQTRSFELVKAAVEIAKNWGSKGSSFVAKIFMGGDFPEARKLLKTLYAEERVIRPPAVRSQSFEVFLVGLNKLTQGEKVGLPLPPPAPPPPPPTTAPAIISLPPVRPKTPAPVAALPPPTEPVAASTTKPSAKKPSAPVEADEPSGEKPASASPKVAPPKPKKAPAATPKPKRTAQPAARKTATSSAKKRSK